MISASVRPCKVLALAASKARIASAALDWALEGLVFLERFFLLFAMMKSVRRWNQKDAESLPRRNTASRTKRNRSNHDAPREAVSRSGWPNQTEAASELRAARPLRLLFHNSIRRYHLAMAQTMKTILIAIGASDKFADEVTSYYPQLEDLSILFKEEDFAFVVEDWEESAVPIWKEIGLLVVWMKKEGIESLQRFNAATYRAARTTLPPLEDELVNWICSINYSPAFVPFRMAWDWKVHDFKSLVAAQGRLDQHCPFLSTDQRFYMKRCLEDLIDKQTRFVKPLASHQPKETIEGDVEAFLKRLGFIQSDILCVRKALVGLRYGNLIKYQRDFFEGSGELTDIDESKRLRFCKAMRFLETKKAMIPEAYRLLNFHFSDEVDRQVVTEETYAAFGWVAICGIY